MVSPLRRIRTALVLATAVNSVSLGIAAAQAPTATTAAAPILAYRNRLLGVFDVASGEPIEGVRVTDMMNHVTALTTKTGTVSLVFLPEGLSLVRVEKIGFQGQTLSVQITAEDTVPLTVLLQPLV